MTRIRVAGVGDPEYLGREGAAFGSARASGTRRDRDQAVDLGDELDIIALPGIAGQVERVDYGDSAFNSEVLEPITRVGSEIVTIVVFFGAVMLGLVRILKRRKRPPDDKGG